MAGVKIRNNAENKGTYKPDIYEEFKEWFASPSFEKRALGVPDQSAFAEKHGVNKDTLTRWKNRPDFETGVRKYIEAMSQGRTSAVIDALYRSAMRGNAKSITLWLKYVEGWRPGKKQPEVKYAPLIQSEDVRSVIMELPEYLQKKYNDLFFEFLRDLTSDVAAYRAGRYRDMSNHPEYDGL